MRYSLVLILFWSLLAPANAQGIITPTFIDSIPMRDGKKLAVDIYIPDTGSGLQYSTVLVQTPYNRMAYRTIGLPMVGNSVSASPFAFLIADWRGFYGSMGAIVAGYDRGKDGYDLVEWIAQQNWSNGRIGTWGPSALGRIQFLTAKKKPPHLICCVPLVASPLYDYQEYYPGGVFRTEYVQQLDNLGFGMSASILAHPTYDMTWQYFVEPPNDYPDSITIPIFMIGGWYDHGTVQNIAFFNELLTDSDPAVRNKHRLLMGPWCHGGFGPVQVGTGQQGQLFYPAAAGWSDSLAMMFLQYYLDSVQNGWDASPVIRYFQMGEDQWHSSLQWPATDVAPYRLYLHSSGGLYPDAPLSAGDFGILPYDPHDPSPTVGGATLRQDLDQGPYDQAPVVESRNDLLKFTSVTLGQNIVMKGKATVHLWVSSDRRDTDFSIRLTDVYPDGRSMLLAEGIRRLRFRTGYAPADTLDGVPGTAYEVVISLPDVAITFLAGHRIRVDVTSSNYPRFDCNLNNGLAMYASGDTLAATNQILLNSVHTSYIELPLIDYAGAVGEKNRNAADVVLYPDPLGIGDEFFIDARQGVLSSIELRDMSGRMIAGLTVSKENNNSRMKCRLPRNVDPGVFIVRIYSQQGVIDKKLVVY